MSSATSGGKDELALLSRQLDELARKWERYFARDPEVRIPPERERTALEDYLRRLSMVGGRRAEDQFRLEQLMHRFATLSALWQRQLRERAEGLSRAAPNVRGAAPVKEDEVARLHREYAAALERLGQKAMDEARFRALLEAQRQKLEAGGAQVEGFSLSVEGDKVRLKAKIKRPREES